MSVSVLASPIASRMASRIERALLRLVREQQAHPLCRVVAAREQRAQAGAFAFEGRQ